MDTYGSPVGETVPFPLRVANRETALNVMNSAKNPRDTRWPHTHIRVLYINLFPVNYFILLFAMVSSLNIAFPSQINQPLGIYQGADYYAIACAYQTRTMRRSTTHTNASAITPMAMMPASIHGPEPVTAKPPRSNVVLTNTGVESSAISTASPLIS